MLDLRSIREGAGVTQVQLAALLDTTQGQISRTESQHDWLLSTLIAYLEALGAEAELFVRIAGCKMIRQRLTGEEK